MIYKTYADSIGCTYQVRPAAPGRGEWAIWTSDNTGIWTQTDITAPGTSREDAQRELDAFARACKMRGEITDRDDKCDTCRWNHGGGRDGCRSVRATTLTPAMQAEDQSAYGCLLRCRYWVPREEV